MAKRLDTSAYKSFDQITGRLDEIIGQVRSKDTSLERSLDLFDEAIALGSKAVDLVDTTEFTPAELERMEEIAEQESAEADASQASSNKHNSSETGSSQAGDAKQNPSAAEHTSAGDAQ